MFTEVHFLNLLWLPLQEHIHQVAAGSSPMWTAALDKHHQALTAEMQGIVPSPDEVLDFSDWVQYICKAIKRHLDVDIPHERATRILALVAPRSLETAEPWLCTFSGPLCASAWSEREWPSRSAGASWRKSLSCP